MRRYHFYFVWNKKRAAPPTFLRWWWLFTLSLIIYKIQMLNRALSRLSNIWVYQQLFLMIIKDVRSMKKLLFSVGTFTNTISLFDTQGLKFVTMNELKFVSAIFIIFFNFFLLSDSPSNYEKCFLFHLKNSFVVKILYFCNFSSSFSQFPDSKGQIKME